MTFEQYLNIKYYGIDSYPKCLSECLERKEQNLNESLLDDFDIKLEREEPVEKYGYIIRHQTMKGMKDRIPLVDCVTSGDRYYIGDVKQTKFLTENRNLTELQPAYPEKYNVCNIGFDKENNRWYGYSHRAICGFGIGDKIFEADFGDGKTLFKNHGRETIKTLEDAKQAARNFAEYVS